MRKRFQNIFYQAYFYVSAIMILLYWIMLIVMLHFYVIADKTF